MFKFNPIKHKIFNHHDKFNDLSKDTNESSNLSTYEQNIHFPIPIIDNAALKKHSFCSDYKIRTINNLFSINFEVIKIIESSLSIRYNQFYKVPSPENLIIGLHYRGYSASDIEIKYSNYLYSIRTTTNAQSVSNTKNFDNLETTTNDQDVSKTKNDNSSNIECTHAEVISLHYLSIQVVNIPVNDHETIHENVANFEKVDKLNNSKNDLKSSAIIEASNSNEDDQKTFEIKENYKEFEILYLNTDRKLLAELWEGITNLNNKLHNCGDFDFGVKEVPYSRQDKIKIPGRLPNLNTNLK
ncbi:17763_t:CDS:2 [Gigaspora margarita]|uniref:17763_t:CDS:1 n=1 Tax=Gigaspora margarita TaxID=4874 RepID=A0ABM8VZ98_GIGMA|nr:17763_t:CDS:2 [Gigaspora margarita]